MSGIVVGWDIHRKFSMTSVQQLSEDGELRVLERRRLQHEDRQGLEKWLAGLPKGTPVAMEAAFGWPWIADLLEAFDLEPHLGHPPAVRVLAKHEAKTDRCDSDRLARLQLLGILPESYLAPGPVRQLRERIRYRMALVRLRTGVKNRTHAQLHRLGILHSHSDLFGVAGRRFLDELQLPEASRVVLNGYLALLDQIETLIAEVEAWMEQNLQEDKIVHLLKSLPGVGKILAHVLKAEIGQIERFPSYRHLASYAGLAPVSNDSAERFGRRRCSPACNRTLRWALIEAATTLVKPRTQGADHLKRLYNRLSAYRRANKAQAKVAVARELAKLLFVVWKKGQPYSAIPPARPGTPKPSHRDRRTPLKTRSSKDSVPSDQSGHPMVRRQRNSAGQTLL